jgi:hypothetical protein
MIEKIADMDPTSTVRTDALPAIATLVIPGALTSVPYAWLILDGAPSLRAFLGAHDGIAALIAALVAIAVGFALESAGSYAEVYLIDRRRSDHEQMLQTWWRYLRIAWDKEPIGQRYLRRLLVSFKFELNMFVAILSAIPGVFLLEATERLQRSVSISLLLGMLVAAGLFFWAARGSAYVLAQLRQLLVNGVAEPSFDEAGNPRKPGSA